MRVDSPAVIGPPVFLRSIGVAVALSAAVIGTAPTFSVAAGMMLAILLFLLAERVDAGGGQISWQENVATGERTRWSLPAGIAVVAGIALCGASAAAVATGASSAAQHIPWAIAMLLFGLTAAAVTSPPTRHLNRADHAALAVLACVCGLIFFWQVATVPAEVHGDEAEVGLDALRLLEDSGRGLFSAGWFGLPILHAGPTALGLMVFGADLFGLRATSAVLATSSVFLLYAIVRRLAGTPLAFTAAFVLATQRYFIHIGRTGFHYIDPPFFSLLALWLMIRLWQDRRRSSAIWCGIVLGLAMHTYFATRVVPLLLALTALAVGARAVRGERLRHMGDLALVAVIALAVGAPMGAYFAGNLDEFFGRVQETSIFDAESREHLAGGYGTTELRPLLAMQLRRALSVFHFVGDTSVQYGYAAPLLDLASGVFLLAGLGTVLAHPTALLGVIALLWTAAPLILGGALTIDTPFFPRLSGIVPFVALIVGVGVLRVAETVSAVLVSSARRSRTALVVSSLLLAIVAAFNTATYFRHYAVEHRHSPLPELAERIIRDGSGLKTYLFDVHRRASIWHGTLSFLVGPFDREDVHDVDGFFSNANVDARRSLFIVMEGSDRILTRLQENFGPLDIEVQRNRDGHVRFYSARVQGAIRGKASPRGDVDAQRAHPWLALIAFLASVSALAAILQRRRKEPQPAPGESNLLARPPPAAVAPPAAPAPSPAMQVAALLLIVFVAAWLRLSHLDQVPAGFYCDEAGNLYNAASILRTGRDETGTFLPLYVWSFDTSYKNPVFVYASTAMVALFGPTPFAARATAAAFGIGAVVAIFFFGRAIGGAVVGLMAAMFLAIVPWHLHFSRIAFELIAFPTLFLIGATALVGFVDGRRTLAWAAAILGLSLYTYVPAKLFVPAFLCGFALLFYREMWARRREVAIAAVVFTVVAMPVVVFDLANHSRSTQYARNMTFLGGDTGVVETAVQLAGNYIHFFSPIFLFRHGDPVLRHAVRNHGELYPAMAPLLLIGLLAIVQARSRRAALLLLWLLLYPLAAALIVREIPSASRGIIGVPAFCLLAALGADWIWQRCSVVAGARIRPKVIRSVASAALLIVLTAQSVRYWNHYTEDYPLYSAKHFIGFQYGHQAVVEWFMRHYDEFDRLILTTNLSNQPEIFLRVFAGLRQPPSAGAPPFEMPAKMDRGTPFELHLYRPGERIAFAVVPQDLLYMADYTILETIRAPDGGIAFLIVEVREVKDFVHVWMVAGPYPTAGTPPLPAYDPAAPPSEAPGGRQWLRYQLRKAPVYVDTLFEEQVDDACAWALNFLHSDTDQSVHVFAGFDDAGEVWVNGRSIPLFEQDNPFQTWVDTSFGTAELQEGRNAIAVKTCDVSGGWSFYFRLAGDDGKRVPGVEWEYGFEEGL